MTSNPDQAGVDPDDLRTQVAALRRAEDAFAATRHEFDRLRNLVDSAGELALYQRLCTAGARLDAIKEDLNGFLELRTSAQRATDPHNS